MRMFIKEGISIRILPVFIYSLFFFTYICLFFAVKINLANADLGRHIINGFNIVNGNAKQVLYSDFYTYTNPSFPHINHHYLSGVIFYYIYIFSGFVGLSYFYAFLGGTCLFILYLYAYKKVGLILATLSVLLFLPFFSFRTEIRPEVFTYLFFTLHALVLVENRKNLKLRHYVLIFVTQAIGINLHNYAVFSFFIPLVLLVEQFLSKNVDAVKKLMLVFVAQLLGTLANPFGVHILLVPLKPFFGMGVQISENLPLLANTKLLFLSIYVILGLICAFASIFVSKNKRLLGVALLTVLFACLSLFMFRIIMLFNIVFFIFAINFLGEVITRYPVLPLKKLSVVLPIILLTMLSIPLSRQFGVGLRPGVEKGGEFILKNNLVDKRVFNDYNVGGYAIFYLSQNESVMRQGKKVYVHNVPESIPVAFMRNWHTAYMNGSFLAGHKVKYDFDYLLLSTYKQDPVFLLARLNDPEWKLVFYDEYVAVFVKNAPKYSNLIRRNEVSATTKEYILRTNVHDYTTCSIAGFKTIKNVCSTCKALCITPWGDDFIQKDE